MILSILYVRVYKWKKMKTFHDPAEWSDIQAGIA